MFHGMRGHADATVQRVALMARKDFILPIST
jgi:hypothetical protein